MLTELTETMGLAWVLAHLAADLIEREAQEQQDHAAAVRAMEGGKS